MNTQQLTKSILSICIGGMALTASHAFANMAIRLPGLPETTQDERAFPESFKLYAEPNHVAHDGCDVYTAITLDSAQISGKIAVLEERVGGICDIAVAPDTRVYLLKRQENSCGSAIYHGTLATDHGVRTIEIVDRRERQCDGQAESRITVTESHDGQTRTLFSGDALEAPELPATAQ